MATLKKSANTKTSAASLKGIKGPGLKAVKQMAEDGLKVQVVGRVKNGKVELDQASLEAMARRFPNAEMSFVAVNAPFDPMQKSTLLEVAA